MSKSPSLILLLLLLLLLAACAGPAEEIRPTPISAGGGEGGGSADEGGGVGQAINLRLWTPQDDAHNAADQALIAAYTAANPGVIITLETFDPATYPQTVASALANGTAADIVHLPGAACALAAGGSLAETPATLLAPADATTRFYPAAIGDAICDNRLYALPQSLDPVYGVALVNTATAAQAGLSDVAAGWATWDELIADARALSVGQGSGMTRAGFHFIDAEALPAMFYALILQNGGQYAAADGALTVNTPQGAAALSLLKRLVDEGAIDPTVFNDAGGPIAQAVADGRAAMGLVAPSAVAALVAARPDVAAALAAAPLPAAGGAPGFVAGPGRALAVSRGSAAPDVAWDFVRFAALDPANSLNWSLTAGALPALRANGEGAAAGQLLAQYPQFAAWLPLLPLAQPEGELADRVWRDVAYSRLLTFLQGGATPEETLAAIDAAP